VTSHLQETRGSHLQETTKKKEERKKESGGVKQASTPPPQASPTDEALKKAGYDAGQRKRLIAAHGPMTPQEIADLPGYIAALKAAGKRSPLGIVYNELMDGQSIPHPEQDEAAAAEQPMTWILDEATGKKRPSDPARWQQIEAKRLAELASAGLR